MAPILLTRNVRDAFRVRTGGPFAWPAARAFLSMLVPLAILLQLDRLDLVAGAVFGALTSVYCRTEPYRQQARSLAVVAVAMVVAVLIGDLIALATDHSVWNEPLALLGTAAVGGVATAIATAVKLGPPGGLIFAFATGACAHLTITPATVGPHIAVTAISAAFAWAVSALGARIGGLNPQRRVVAAALNATAEHLRVRPNLTTRHRAAVAVEAAWNSVALVGRRHQQTVEHRQLVDATETCEALLAPDDDPNVAAGDVRAAATAVRAGRGFPGLTTGTGQTAIPPTPASRWRVIRSVLRAAARPHRRSANSTTAGPVGCSHPDHSVGWLLPYALRVGLAALLAGTAANLLGLGHAYWAAVSAISVLQATSTSTSVPRMLQRVTGTLFGVLLGLGVLMTHPAPWVIIVLLAALQWGAEMTVLANYAFGLLFATPVALLVSSIINPTPAAELAASRFWVTLLGAVIAVAVAWALPHRSWLRRVDRALDRVRDLSRTDPIQPVRLRAALVELHEAHDVAAGEVATSKLPTEELLEISHHAYVLLDAHGRTGTCADPTRGA